MGLRKMHHDFAPGTPELQLVTPPVNCASGIEDAEHFISSCQALLVKRLSLLQDAPPNVLAQLPDPTSDPKHFSDIMLGTCWIDDPDVHCFCIQFLNQLKLIRANKLFLPLVPKGQLSHRGGKKGRKIPFPILVKMYNIYGKRLQLSKTL